MSTDSVTPFFAKESNLRALQILSSKLPDNDSQKEPDIIRPLKLLLHCMVNTPSHFDKCCAFNINQVGGDFISLARNYEPRRDDIAQQQQKIFALAYRFVCELEFSYDKGQSLHSDLREVQFFVDANIDLFPADLKQKLIYAGYLMPVHIARELLQHPDLASMRAFNEQQVSAPKLKQEWDDELRQKEEQVTTLSQQLEKLRTGFNFVGLVDGFRQLAEQKIADKRVAFWALMALGLLVVAPVILDVWFISSHLDSLEKYKEILLFGVPPMVTLEVLLVYFFRVVLVHFRSIKAQLLQLELRTALCQFIESYSTYSEKIKEKNPTALEKFESLVFSGLLASEEQLPSTFDGTEQLAKLFKSMKSSA